MSVLEEVQNLLKDKYQLEEYQKGGILYALGHHHSINASGMGTGKTLMALATMYYHQRNKKFPVLCVVPACVEYSWSVEIKRTSRIPKEITFLRSQSGEGADFAICSYAYFRSHKENLTGYSGIIFDEAHALKNIQAKVTQAAHEYMEDNRIDVCLLLTGTPLKNRVPELYSLLCMTSYNRRRTSGISVLDQYSFYEFQNKFCFLELKHIGRGRKIRSYYGLKNPDLLKALLKNKFYRVDSSVLGLERAIEKDIFINYPKDGELIKAWEEFNKGSSVNSVVKREAALYAAKFTVEYINGLIESSYGPIVVFTDHVDSAEYISEHTKGKSSFIHGGVCPNLRNNYISDFQNNKLDVIVLTYGTSSTGINLQNSNQMVFNDLPWVPEDLSQAKARIRRMGQNKQCYYHYIVGGKSVKYLRDKVIAPKEKVLKEFYGNARREEPKEKRGDGKC